MRAFSNKATAAFGTLFGGVLLSAIEFPEKAVRGEVHADTVWNLGFVAGPATSTFSLLALLFYLRYRINRRRHAEVVPSCASGHRRPPAAIECTVIVAGRSVFAYVGVLVVYGFGFLVS